MLMEEEQWEIALGRWIYFQDKTNKNVKNKKDNTIEMTSRDFYLFNEPKCAITEELEIQESLIFYFSSKLKGNKD